MVFTRFGSDRIRPNFRTLLSLDGSMQPIGENQRNERKKRGAPPRAGRVTEVKNKKKDADFAPGCTKVDLAGKIQTTK